MPRWRRRVEAFVGTLCIGALGVTALGGTVAAARIHRAVTPPQPPPAWQLACPIIPKSGSTIATVTDGLGGAPPGEPTDATAKYATWTKAGSSHSFGACRWPSSKDSHVTLTIVFANASDGEGLYSALVDASPSSHETATVSNTGGKGVPGIDAVYWRGRGREQNILVHDDAAVFQLVTTSPKVTKAMLSRLAYAAVAMLE